MSMIYQEHHADLAYLNGKLVGIIGYGNLGRPIALNLRDSGVDVIVSERDLNRYKIATREGFRMVNIPELVQQTDIILLLVPDELMPQIYLDEVSPYLSRGDTLVFGSAYNLAFGYIEAPPFVDIGLVAPRTIGVAVRERYLADRGFFSFVSVGQDATGKAWDTVLSLAKAIGSLRPGAGAIEVVFEREAELDLFLQQAILPLMHQTLVTAAELLMEEGYPPEAAFADLYISGELEDYR